MNKKKILAGVLSAVITVGAISGIVIGVKASRRSTVMVIQASELNYGGYWGSSSQMQGMISSDVSQDVYLTDTQTVSQVMVKEGDQVKEGDVLMSYDTTLTNLNLEREKLNRDQINLKLQVAQDNLKKLRNTKPVSDGGGSSGGIDVPDFNIPDEPIDPEPTVEPTEEPTPEPSKEPVEKDEYKITFNNKGHGKKLTSVLIGKGKSFQDYLDSLNNKGMSYLLVEDGFVFGGWFIDEECLNRFNLKTIITEDLELYAKWTPAESDYAGVVASSELTPDTLPFNISDGDGLGTVVNPYRYLCTDRAVITAGFMNTLRANAQAALDQDSNAHYFYTLEIHEGNTVAGSVLKTWMQDAIDLAKQEQDFPDDWQGILNLATGNIDVSKKPAEQTDQHEDGTTVQGTAVSMRKMTPVALNDTGSGSAGLGVLSGELSYTKEELEKAIREQEEDIKSLQLDLKESDLKIQQAEKALTDGVVRAKLNGVVKKVGDPKNPPKDGSAFLQINSTEGLFVRGGISELMLDQIHEGDTVSVMSWQSGTVCEAVIKEISPYPDESGMFSSGDNASYYPFTAYIASGGDNLTNQEWVQITAEGDMGSMMGSGDTLYLWKAFIREEDGEKYVYLRDENGRLKKQVITVGKLSGEGYEILSGVTFEDWLAFPYGKDVKDGAKTKEGSTSELYGY